MDQIKSLLFVPATEKLLAKSDMINADAVIYDLEDSIAEGNKEQALQLLENFLARVQQKVRTYVRINRHRENIELARLDKCKFDGYMIPKYESAGFVDQNRTYIKNRDIIALIETPMGLVKIEDIVSSPAVTAVAFGAEDFTCTVNMQNDVTALSYAKSRMVTYAAAYQKAAYDTPSFNYKDLQAFQTEVEISRAMGFTGNLAIHPDQVPMINKEFNLYDYDHIRDVIEQFEAAPTGVLRLDNRIYEKPHIDRLKKILANRPVK